MGEGGAERGDWTAGEGAGSGTVSPCGHRGGSRREMSSPRVCSPTSWIPPNSLSFKHFDSVVISQEKKKIPKQNLFSGMDRGLWRTWVHHQMRNLGGTPVSGTLGGPGILHHGPEEGGGGQEPRHLLRERVGLQHQAQAPEFSSF